MSTNHHSEITAALAISHTNLNVPLAALDQQLTDMDDGTHNFSAINIDGGTIDGATIGGASAAAATFSNIAATGNLFGPAWHVTLGGGTQTIASGGAPVLVQFDTEVLDSNSNFNITTYTLTPTVQGWYFCFALLTWTAAWNAAKSMQAIIVSNNGSNGTGYVDTGGAQVDSVATYDIRLCNGSSDTIAVYAVNNDSVSRDINGNPYQTYFAGWRIQ